MVIIDCLELRFVIVHKDIENEDSRGFLGEVLNCFCVY